MRALDASQHRNLDLFWKFPYWIWCRTWPCHEHARRWISTIRRKVHRACELYKVQDLLGRAVGLFCSSLLRIVDFLVSTMCKRELQYMSKETYCATEEILYFVEFAWSMSSSANRWDSAPGRFVARLGSTPDSMLDFPNIFEIWMLTSVRVNPLSVIGHG